MATQDVSVDEELFNSRWQNTPTTASQLSRLAVFTGEEQELFFTPIAEELFKMKRPRWRAGVLNPVVGDKEEIQQPALRESSSSLDPTNYIFCGAEWFPTNCHCWWCGGKLVRI